MVSYSIKLCPWDLYQKLREILAIKENKQKKMHRKKTVLYTITKANVVGHNAHSSTCVKNAMAPIVRNNAQEILKNPQQNSQVARNRDQSKQSSKIITPINSRQLESWLEGYDETKKKFLVTGFNSGFKIPYSGTRNFVKNKNLKSALDNLPILKEKNQP